MKTLLVKSTQLVILNHARNIEEANTESLTEVCLATTLLLKLIISVGRALNTLMTLTIILAQEFLLQVKSLNVELGVVIHSRGGLFIVKG